MSFREARIQCLDIHGCARLARTIISRLLEGICASQQLRTGREHDCLRFDAMFDAMIELNLKTSAEHRCG